MKAAQGKPRGLRKASHPARADRVWSASKGDRLDRCPRVADISLSGDKLKVSNPYVRRSDVAARTAGTYGARIARRFLRPECLSMS
jgi:hypothetical protein